MMNKTGPNHDLREALQYLSSQDFLALGVQEFAYIKPVAQNEGTAYEIHAADGTRISVLGDEAHAEALIRQNDLTPVHLH